MSHSEKNKDGMTVEDMKKMIDYLKNSRKHASNKTDEIRSDFRENVNLEKIK